MEDDLYQSLSVQLKCQIKDIVLGLYKLDLHEAKEKYSILQIKVEEEVGRTSYEAFTLAKKFMFDLKNYVSYEDAAEFINERRERVENDIFGHFILSQYLYATRKDEMDPEEIYRMLQKLANFEEDPVKKLLAETLAARYYSENGGFQASMLRGIEGLSENIDCILENGVLENEGSFYLVSAYDSLSFLYRDLNKYQESINWLYKALRITDTHDKDAGLSLKIETYLMKKLQYTTLDPNEFRFQDILKKIENATSEEFIAMYGIKTLREAFIEVSIAATKTEYGNMYAVNQSGKRLLKFLENIFGERHHEVVFIASRLALNKDSPFTRKKHLQIVLTNIDGIGEESKILLTTKIRSCINLHTVLKEFKRSEEAERYIRESLRLHITMHGNCHQYTAQAMKVLAFQMIDKGELEEGLTLLNKCLKISVECKPGFTQFHDKVRKAIEEYSPPA